MQCCKHFYFHQKWATASRCEVIFQTFWFCVSSIHSNMFNCQRLKMYPEQVLKTPIYFFFYLSRLLTVNTPLVVSVVYSERGQVIKRNSLVVRRTVIRISWAFYAVYVHWTLLFRQKDSTKCCVFWMLIERNERKVLLWVFTES